MVGWLVEGMIFGSGEREHHRLANFWAPVPNTCWLVADIQSTALPLAFLQRRNHRPTSCCLYPKLFLHRPRPVDTYTPTLESSLVGNLVTRARVKTRNFTKQRSLMRKKDLKQVGPSSPRISFFLPLECLFLLFSNLFFLFFSSVFFSSSRVSFSFLLESVFSLLLESLFSFS